MSSPENHVHTVGRRALICSSLVGGMASIAQPAVAGASTGRHRATPSPEASPGATPANTTTTITTTNSVLLVFFSRAGENYYYGDRIDLEIGNTKVLAGMIADRISCDLYEIEAADPYPDSYDETRDRNVQEQDADARPVIANPLAAIDGYDTVIIGSPIWSSRPPMIMSTFAESFDFTGKTVLPVVTYAVSGMGGTERIYEDACRGATFAEGLAVQGEEVQDASEAVESWLQRVGLLGA